MGVGLIGGWSHHEVWSHRGEFIMTVVGEAPTFSSDTTQQGGVGGLLIQILPCGSH